MTILTIGTHIKMAHQPANPAFLTTGIKTRSGRIIRRIIERINSKDQILIPPNPIS